MRNAKFRAEKCDLFSGEWIPDNSAPAYTNETCSFISGPQNCMSNGRPDTGYLYWRWKPYCCNLTNTGSMEFLNAMRNKSLAFIGDSIVRNQIESLLCLLSKGEEAVLVYHDEKYQSKTWFFPLHNITMGLIWAPFLVESTESQSKSNLQLMLDVPDNTWASQYHKYDYISVSVGQWFLKDTVFWENGKKIGCHNCKNKNLPELGMDYSYRRALETAFSFMACTDHKPELVVLRTWTPDHFEYGKWYNGGVCNRTEPFKEGQYSPDPVDAMMHKVEIEEYKKGLKIGLPLRLHDTYHMSMLRPDAHPGPYRKPYPDISKKPQNDCLHWCLPGPIDTWNELLMNIMLSEIDLRSAN